jgi:hypothetical protein
MADRKPEDARVPPATASPQVDQKSQRERFIEAAEEAGVTDEGFDKALSKVAPEKRK